MTTKHAGSEFDLRERMAESSSRCPRRAVQDANRVGEAMSVGDFTVTKTPNLILRA